MNESGKSVERTYMDAKEFGSWEQQGEVQCEVDTNPICIIHEVVRLGRRERTTYS